MFQFRLRTLLLLTAATAAVLAVGRALGWSLAAGLAMEVPLVALALVSLASLAREFAALDRRQKILHGLLLALLIGLVLAAGHMLSPG